MANEPLKVTTHVSRACGKKLKCVFIARRPCSIGRKKKKKSAEEKEKTTEGGLRGFQGDTQQREEGDYVTGFGEGSVSCPENVGLVTLRGRG